MQMFLLGLSCSVVGGAIGVGLFLFLSRKERKQAKPQNDVEAQRAIALRKGFEQLMTYDVATAVRGKKVE